MSLAATQLRAYINSSRSLQKEQRATWAKLARRKVRQEYIAEIGIRAFRRVVDKGAKAYVRELRVTEKWSAAFPTTDRNVAAREMERDFRGRWSRGELDSLLPLKQRPKRRHLTGNPIRKGYTRATISDNVRTLKAEGKPNKQAVAIALQTARDAWRERHPGEPLPSSLREAPKKKKTKKRKTSSPSKRRTKKKTKKRVTKKRAIKKRATKKRTARRKR